jgi:protein TonB
MALEGRGAAIALGAVAVAAVVAVSLWLQNRPPAEMRTPTPVPAPSPAPGESAGSPTPLVAAEPTPSPPPETFGSVYEVTIPRPRATNAPSQDESPPYDLRRVDQKDVTAPVLVSRIEPAYPEIARRGRAEGQVVVEAVISDRGEVQDARVVHSTTMPILNEEALRAVRQWRYRPALYRGRPVRVYVTVTVTFRLN